MTEPSKTVAGYRTIGNPRPKWWKGVSDDALALMLAVRDGRAKFDYESGLHQVRGMSVKKICDASDELIELGYASFVEFPDGGLGLELTERARRT